MGNYWTTEIENVEEPIEDIDQYSYVDELNQLIEKRMNEIRSRTELTDSDNSDDVESK